MRRALILLFPVLLGPTAGASAQEPETSAFRDRLSRMDDTLELRSIELTYARTRDADSVVAAGLAALRLWEVTGQRSHARRSRNHFDRAAGRDPANAWAHYGHALSLEADMNRDPPLIVTHVNASRALGLDAVSRARRALERAVALDPQLPGAVELLARYASETRDTDGLLLARSSFQREADAPGAGAAPWIGLASTSRELRDFPAAAGAARRAVAANPTSADAQLELAKSLAMLPDSLAAAGAAYRLAMQHADAGMLARLWGDAGIIARPAELEAWEQAEPAARAALLYGFWDVRGALAGMSAEERAAEHYRRLVHARREYPRHGGFGAAPLNALRWEKIDPDFDDRGVIYVRHGAPEHTFNEAPLDGYIAWYYRDEQGRPLSFHFAKFTGEAGFSRDYILMRNLPCVLDPMAVIHDFRLARLTRMVCDPQTRRQISLVIARDAERALRTDSHRAAFDTEVAFHYDTYTFRGSGGTDVVASVGIPLSHLPPGARSLQVSLAVIDSATGAVQRGSFVTERVERVNVPGRIVRGHVVVTARAIPNAAYRVDVRDASDRRIGGIYGGVIELRDYSGDTLMVSDIVLAEPVEGGLFRREGTSLALAPTQVFPAGELRAYYEVYNLPPGAAYRTELAVQPARRGLLSRLFGGSGAVQLRFEDAAPVDGDGTLRILRDIRVPVDAGDYVMRLTLTGPDGRRISRERWFIVEPR